MTAIAPLFVVGTGRCGSTMLSELLREHEHVLSLSEFFTLTTDLGGRIAEGFSPEPIDAAAFWRLVAGAHPKQTTMLRHDVVMPEVLYRPTGSSRFTAETGVPAILQTVLPHLCADADDLFAEVEAFVATLPTAPVAAHYARLFGWLARRFGKRTWVERSGGSLRIVQRLTDAFPTARFLHIVRDGRACASSMSKHLGFRMALVAMQLAEILGADPYESTDRTWISDVPDELLDFLPERFDGEAFRAHRLPLPLFGHYWSGEIVQGLRELDWCFDRIVTSPWARAVQTAELLAPVTEGPTIATDLLCDKPRPELFAMIAETTAPERKLHATAVVGHEPWLSELVAWLTFGDPHHSEGIEIKKGGMVWLEGTAIPGGMKLRALLTPRLLRALR